MATPPSNTHAPSPPPSVRHAVSARTFEELPVEAQNYINRIEELSGVPVTWIGVGVGRLDMATKGFAL